jgi:hypothetical protein
MDNVVKEGDRVIPLLSVAVVVEVSAVVPVEVKETEQR